MKLYTEQQLRKIYDLAFINLDQDGCHIIDEDRYFEQKIEELTPIELPSDEEIANKSKSIDKDGLSWENDFARDSFKSGAKWMKEQILNQNK